MGLQSDYTQLGQEQAEHLHGWPGLHPAVASDETLQHRLAGTQ